MKILQYIKNYITTSPSFDSNNFYSLLEGLKQDICAHDCSVIPFPARINTENEKIEPWCLYSFVFVEKDVAVLRNNNVGKNICDYEIRDHNIAEIVRKFCRNTAAKIIISILPFFPVFKFDFLSVYFHYDTCLPEIKNTIRIYSVTIYMDRIRSLNLKRLNEENIKEYFEFENGQVDFLFYQWKSRGVLMYENQKLI
jgi:hypothetical protein